MSRAKLTGSAPVDDVMGSPSRPWCACRLLPVTGPRSTLAPEEGVRLKVVVIGGTGLVGSTLVAKLVERGHEAIAASPRLGVNTITGEGLATALEGASVVVDVANSANFEYATALEFFERSTHNLVAAERAAGVGHHVGLSVV